MKTAIALRLMPQNAIDHVNISSGNGLVPGNNSSKLELMLVQIYVTMYEFSRLDQ